MPNSDEKKEKINIDQINRLFLEPIPLDSFLRHQILELFLKTELEDFQAQILLSLVLHGGQIKPITLANDIRCSPTRLELPDGFPSLIDLNLIVMSHTRPKTVILAIGIDELIERLAKKSIKTKDFLDPDLARELLHKLDQFTVRNTSKDSKNEQIDDFPGLLNYFTNLEQLCRKIPSLFSLLFYSLSSLGMGLHYAFILSKLIASGGKIEKRNFYLEEIKKNNHEILEITPTLLLDDLQKLDYLNNDRKCIIEKLNNFLEQNKNDYQISNENQFNIVLDGLKEYLQSTSMSIKERGRKTKYLTLVKTISQLGDSLYQSAINYQNSHELEFRILKLAYSNVKLVDSEIFLSTIADPSSTRKRLETDIKFAQKIYLVLLHSHFVEDIFLKIFDSENLSFELHLIAAEELKDLFTEMLAKHKRIIQGKRGILTSDAIIFISSDEIPQDILVGNTIILFYKAGASMIIIHEEITKNNPTEINTIFTDVELAFQYFNKITIENYKKSTNIMSLIRNKRE